MNTSLRGRVLAGVALGVLTLALSAVIWVADLPLRAALIVLIAIVASVSYRWILFRFPDIGAAFCRELRLAGWKATLFLTGGLSMLLMTAGWLTGAWHTGQAIVILDKSLTDWLFVKLPTVFVQQWLLQLIVVPLICRWLQCRWLAVALGGMCFATLHLPNPVLMALTMLAGCFWIAIFLRFGQLLPLVTSHFLLAVLAANVGGEYVLNMRVGPDCCSLLPRPELIAGTTVTVFPNSVDGVIHRFLQVGNELVLEGWACDEAHRTCPRGIYLATENQLILLRVTYDQERGANPSSSSTRFWFQARVGIGELTSGALTEMQAGRAARVYAANANGWLSELACLGKIVPSENAVPNRPTQIFPIRIDGRINRIVRRGSKLHVRGWAADIRQKEIPQELWVRVGSRLLRVELRGNHCERPDIVASFSAPGLLKSGFEVELSDVRPDRGGHLAFFVPAADGTLYPVRLTHRAELDVVQQRDPVASSAWR